MTPTEKVIQEMQAFRQALPELLKEHAGQWVIFWGGKVVGFYQDEDSAYGTAIQDLGPHAGFVVARVWPEQPRPTSFALMFGVVR